MTPRLKRSRSKDPSDPTHPLSTDRRFHTEPHFHTPAQNSSLKATVPSEKNFFKKRLRTKTNTTKPHLGGLTPKSQRSAFGMKNAIFKTNLTNPVPESMNPFETGSRCRTPKIGSKTPGNSGWKRSSGALFDLEGLNRFPADVSGKRYIGHSNQIGMGLHSDLGVKSRKYGVVRGSVESKNVGKNGGCNRESDRRGQVWGKVSSSQKMRYLGDTSSLKKNFGRKVKGSFCREKRLLGNKEGSLSRKTNEFSDNSETKGKYVKLPSAEGSGQPGRLAKATKGRKSNESGGKRLRSSRDHVNLKNLKKLKNLSITKHKKMKSNVLGLRAVRSKSKLIDRSLKSPNLLAQKAPFRSIQMQYLRNEAKSQNKTSPSAKLKLQYGHSSNLKRGNSKSSTGLLRQNSKGRLSSLKAGATNNNFRRLQTGKKATGMKATRTLGRNRSVNTKSGIKSKRTPSKTANRPSRPNYSLKKKRGGRLCRGEKSGSQRKRLFKTGSQRKLKSKSPALKGMKGRGDRLCIETRGGEGGPEGREGLFTAYETEEVREEWLKRPKVENGKIGGHVPKIDLKRMSHYDRRQEGQTAGPKKSVLESRNIFSKPWCGSENSTGKMVSEHKNEMGYVSLEGCTARCCESCFDLKIGGCSGCKTAAMSMSMVTQVPGEEQGVGESETKKTFIVENEMMPLNEDRRQAKTRAQIGREPGLETSQEREGDFEEHGQSGYHKIFTTMRPKCWHGLRSVCTVNCQVEISDLCEGCREVIPCSCGECDNVILLLCEGCLATSVQICAECSIRMRSVCGACVEDGKRTEVEDISYQIGEQRGYTESNEGPFQEGPAPELAPDYCEYGEEERSPDFKPVSKTREILWRSQKHMLRQEYNYFQTPKSPKACSISKSGTKKQCKKSGSAKSLRKLGKELIGRGYKGEVGKGEGRPTAETRQRKASQGSGGLYKKGANSDGKSGANKQYRFKQNCNEKESVGGQQGNYPKTHSHLPRSYKKDKTKHRTLPSVPNPKSAIERNLGKQTYKLLKSGAKLKIIGPHGSPKKSSIDRPRAKKYDKSPNRKRPKKTNPRVPEPRKAQISGRLSLPVGQAGGEFAALLRRTEGGGWKESAEKKADFQTRVDELEKELNFGTNEVNIKRSAADLILKGWERLSQPTGDLNIENLGRMGVSQEMAAKAGKSLNQGRLRRKTESKVKTQRGLSRSKTNTNIKLAPTAKISKHQVSKHLKNGKERSQIGLKADVENGQDSKRVGKGQKGKGKSRAKGKGKKKGCLSSSSKTKLVSQKDLMSSKASHPTFEHLKITFADLNNQDSEMGNLQGGGQYPQTIHNRKKVQYVFQYVYTELINIFIDRYIACRYLS